MIIGICIKRSIYDGGQQEVKRVLDPCSAVWDDVFNLYCLVIKSPIFFQNRGLMLIHPSLPHCYRSAHLPSQVFWHLQYVV